MRADVNPGSVLRGDVPVPGDKSIAHRWLLLAGTATGSSRLVGLPASLDVRSTAVSLAQLTGRGRPALDAWVAKLGPTVKDGGYTWNAGVQEGPSGALEVEGEGRGALVQPSSSITCGNSGTTMRLLMGIVASAPFEVEFVGDESLSRRPMERVAEPLRRMGADVWTESGHAPVRVRGGDLRGATHVLSVPSAQVKGALLLAGVAADDTTSVHEPASTRDHTERALEALGAPVRREEGRVTVERFQHQGFAGSVPGDVSSAAFLIGAAAVTGSSLTIHDVGLNPTRLRFLDVLARMGVQTERRVDRHELGEPVGELWVAPCEGPGPVQVSADELPLVHDEVPVLAAVAALAPGESRFSGAGELRVKESDRIALLTEGIRGLGGEATDEGNDLLVAGGGLSGGRARSGGDHRIAMGLAVAALGATAPSEIHGFGSVDVSFPGFGALLHGLGAAIEVSA